MVGHPEARLLVGDLGADGSHAGGALMRLSGVLLAVVLPNTEEKLGKLGKCILNRSRTQLFLMRRMI